MTVGEILSLNVPGECPFCNGELFLAQQFEQPGVRSSLSFSALVQNLEARAWND